MERTVPGSPPSERESVDPELLELPAPPRGPRLATLTLMALVVAASLALLATLRTDIAYFFASDAVTDHGEVTELDAAALVPNDFVRIEGTPMASRTVRYARALTGQRYAVFPLAGQRTVWVRVPLDGEGVDEAVARRAFSGRLVTFGQMGLRLRAVRGYLGGEMDAAVSSETFVLLADRPPGSYGWALVLALLCVLFIALDVGLLLRWFRPLPRHDAQAAEHADSG